MESDGGGELRNYRFEDEVTVEDHRLQRATRDGWAKVESRVAIIFEGGLKNWLFLFSQKF